MYKTYTNRGFAKFMIDHFLLKNQITEFFYFLRWNKAI